MLPALGVRPALGRWFTREEEADGSRPVVLSHKAWQDYYGGRRMVGETVTLPAWRATQANPMVALRAE